MKKKRKINKTATINRLKAQNAIMAVALLEIRSRKEFPARMDPWEWCKKRAQSAFLEIDRSIEEMKRIRDAKKKISGQTVDTEQPRKSDSVCRTSNRKKQRKG